MRRRIDLPRRELLRAAPMLLLSRLGLAQSVQPQGLFIHAPFGGTLNPNFKSTNITLDAAKTTATAIATANGSAYSITGHSTGKWYYEFTRGAGNTDDTKTQYGMGNSSSGTTGYQLADDADSGGCINFSYYVNRAFQGGADSGSVGDTLGVAYDLDTHQAWFTNLNFNDFGSTNDPATNMGGITYSGLNAGPYFAGVGVEAAGYTCTINLGKSAPFKGGSAWILNAGAAAGYKFWG